MQYYRASTVALTLDGYNNSAALGSDPNVPATPLPEGVDTVFLSCVNNTIGAAVPLVSGAFHRYNVSSSAGVLLLLWFGLALGWRLS